MPSVYVRLRTYEHLTYQKFTGLICSFLGHFIRRFKAVSEKLAVSIFRVEGRFSIMKTRDVTSVTSQELVYHFYSPYLELKIAHLLKFYTISGMYNLSHF